MKASTIAFLAFTGQHSAAAAEVKVHDKKSFVRSLQTIDDIFFGDTEDEFCRDLEELESHMTDSFRDIVAPTSDEYDCECSKPSDGVLVIDCDIKYGDDGDNYEQITFKANDEGVYELVQTYWGDSSYYDGSRPVEIFNFENGKLDSCKSSVCKSCSICDDKKSISTEDCVSYTAKCSDEYTGAWANTFDFGEIKTSGTTRHAVTTIFGSVLTTVLVTFLLV